MDIRSAPVSWAKTMSLTANGLCDLIAARSLMPMPASSSACIDAGIVAAGMKLFSTLA